MLTRRTNGRWRSTSRWGPIKQPALSVLPLRCDACPSRKMTASDLTSVVENHRSRHKAGIRKIRSRVWVRTVLKTTTRGMIRVASIDGNKILVAQRCITLHGAGKRALTMPSSPSVACRNRSQSVASLSIDVNAIKKYIPGQRKENKDQMLVSQRHEDLVKIFKLRSLLEQDGGIQGKGSDEDLKMR